jgi:cell division septation protein DedD
VSRNARPSNTKAKAQTVRSETFTDCQRHSKNAHVTSQARTPRVLTPGKRAGRPIENEWQSYLLE